MILPMQWPALSIALLTACGRVGFETVDATSDVPRCRVDDTTIFCDDFEGPDLTRWDVVTRVTRDSPVPHAGSGAARASITGAPDSAWLEATPAMLPELPRLSVRVWFYATAGSSLGHANLITLRNSASAEEVTIFWSAAELRAYVDTSSTASYPSTAFLQHERWTCVELDVVIDDTAGALELRVDGAVAIQTSSFDTRVAGDFDQLKVGLNYSAAPQQLAATIYFDDVHLGATAVGCGS
jgi:hypothetical protein